MPGPMAHRSGTAHKIDMDRARQGRLVREKVRLPPLVETDEAVVVHVDLFKEPGESPLGHREPRLLEGQAQLLLA